MKRVAIYSRKSKETDKGESTKIQIKLCKEYFERTEPCEFEFFEDEGFSGGNTNRPAFQLMMEKVKSKEFDIVVVYKLDRISRNISDFFKVYDALVKYNTELVSITEGFDPRTPIGKMMMLLLAAFADMERESIKQRVKDNMRELAKQGKWSGGNVPIGYITNRVIENGKKCTYLVSNEDEIQIVKDIYNLYLDGYSTRKIASKINSIHNLSTSQKRVCNILYSPVYVESTPVVHNYLKSNNYEVVGQPNGNGYLTYQKTKVSTDGKKVLNKDDKTIAAVSKHKSIIAAETWIKVHEKLKQVTQDPKPRKSQFTYLAHMVKCGYCGKNMNVYSEPRLRGKQRFFKKTCTCDHAGKNFRGSRLTLKNAEDFTMDFLKECIDINKLKENLLSRNSFDDNNLTIEIKNKTKEINKLDKIINGLIDKVALASERTSKLLLKRVDSASNEKQLLQEELLILEKKKAFNKNASTNISVLHDSITNFIDNFDLLTLDEKQNYIKKIIASITWKGIERQFRVTLLDV